MKTEKSTTKAADASLNKSIKLCARLYGTLDRMVEGHSPDKLMPQVRETLAELNQRIHEFNAYSNVLLTE